MSPARITCVGEILWDVLPSGSTLGGAPVNVAYHLTKMGLAPRLVARVGRDPLGDATLLALRDRGIATTDIQIDAVLQTGAAHVALDPQGKATYSFVTPAAWDALECPAGEFGVVVFGTLGQRHAASRAAIRAIAADATRCVLDINLRPPFVDPEVVLCSLGVADLLKLNDEEVGVLASWYSLPADPSAFAAAAADRFGLMGVCVTCGAEGALVYADGRLYRDAAREVDIVDTVGAGDAFLAAFLAAWLEGQGWGEALSRGNRLASHVAGLPGAMPAYGHEPY